MEINRYFYFFHTGCRLFFITFERSISKLRRSCLVRPPSFLSQLRQRCAVPPLPGHMSISRATPTQSRPFRSPQSVPSPPPDDRTCPLFSKLSKGRQKQIPQKKRRRAQRLSSRPKFPQHPRLSRQLVLFFPECRMVILTFL